MKAKVFFQKHRSTVLVLGGFIGGVLATLAGEQFDNARRALAEGHGWLASLQGAPRATPAAAPRPAGSPAPIAPLPAAPSGAELDTESLVQSYMRSRVSGNVSLSFIDWSDFSTAGDVSSVTLRYRVRTMAGTEMQPVVRFAVQGGTIVKADVIDPGAAPSGAQAAPPPPAPTAPPTPSPVLIDRFSGPIDAAMTGPSMILDANNAYSLGQLQQAEQEAVTSRKPLGFIMVWGQLFGQEADPRSTGSVSALVHFYEVFHQNLVLVFVRHESELGLVPPAVRKGFFGPDEGGYAPNMAVTDATASEFITEIPFRNLDGPGRDALFAAGGKKIDSWLATHPRAVSNDAPTGGG